MCSFIIASNEFYSAKLAEGNADASSLVNTIARKFARSRASIAQLPAVRPARDSTFAKTPTPHPTQGQGQELRSCCARQLQLRQTGARHAPSSWPLARAARAVAGSAIGTPAATTAALNLWGCRRRRRRQLHAARPRSSGQSTPTAATAIRRLRNEHVDAGPRHRPIRLLQVHLSQWTSARLSFYSIAAYNSTFSHGYSKHLHMPVRSVIDY